MEEVKALFNIWIFHKSSHLSSLFKLFLKPPPKFLLFAYISRFPLLLSTAAFMWEKWHIKCEICICEKYFSKQIFRVIRMCLWNLKSFPSRKWWFMCFCLFAYRALDMFLWNALLLNRFRFYMNFIHDLFAHPHI